MSVDPIETKLAQARTRLILDKPFLGALVLRLPLVEADGQWCKTTATDARAFYYNRDYIDALSPRQTQFALAHEALHCALSHFARRQHRVRHLWDIACDYAINPLLIKDGLSPPPDALHLTEFEEMTAEEIYPCLEENDNQQTHDLHLYDADEEGQGSGEGDPRSGSGSPQQQDGGGNQGADGEGSSEGDGNGERSGGARRPPPLGLDERDQLAIQWGQRMAGAAQQALQAGKLSGAMARLVDHLLQPQLPWRMLLARYLAGIAREDYNYLRPSGRREGPAIYPSLRSSQLNVVVVIDTSGSINDDEMAEFLSEVNALKGQVRARVELHGCDAELDPRGPWSFEPWEPLRLPEALRGGGGTRFTPIFSYVDLQGNTPDLLLYFTDADGDFPEQEPHYPVLWLVKGRRKVPWGQRIQLN
ncbi:vWA domain-containing protein [Endothiovibrio diazotrophicus]